MNQLTTSKPNRLFTFGCSFTHWLWPSWSDIIAYDLNIPYYNFGKFGAGNQYIFNMLAQAINTYQIDHYDLVMICWTNSCREDRRLRDGWVTPGNIFTNLDNFYTKEYITKYVDFPIGFSVRDFASMDASRRILENLKCQYHFMSMAEFDLFDQWGRSLHDHEELKILNQLKITYHNLIDKMLPSFYLTLWDNDISNKFKIDQNKIHKDFIDGHPSPQEHLDYLTNIFKEYKFNTSTVEKINEVENLWIKLNKQVYDHTNINEEPISTEELKIIESLETNFI